MLFAIGQANDVQGVGLDALTHQGIQSPLVAYRAVKAVIVSLARQQIRQVERQRQGYGFISIIGASIDTLI